MGNDPLLSIPIVAAGLTSIAIKYRYFASNGLIRIKCNAGKYRRAVRRTASGPLPEKQIIKLLK